MGNGPSLIAQVGCDERDFARGMHATEASMLRSQEQAKVLAAQIALLEREMAGGKTDEMVQRHTKLQASLRETQAEAKAAAKQLAALDAVKPTATSAAAPDESARYQAWLRRADEQERSRRANEAIANARLAMPEASRPQAVVRVVEDAVARMVGGSHGGGGGGLDRSSKQELFHSGRAIVEMLMMGQGGRALEMEAPRLVQALGPSIMAAIGGFSGLLAVLGPLTAVVGAAALGFKMYEVNREANAQRTENARIGLRMSDLRKEEFDPNYFASLDPNLTPQARRERLAQRKRLHGYEGLNMPEEDVESVQDLQKQEEQAQEAIKGTRHKRHSKWNKIFDGLARGTRGLGVGILFGRGDGLNNRDVNRAREQRDQVRGREFDAETRDFGFKERAFKGDESAELDRLAAERDEKKTALENRKDKLSDDEKAKRVALIDREYQLGLEEMERRQTGAKIQADLEERILAIKRAGKDVAEQTAAAELDAAQKKLAAGPQQGDEYKANLNAVESASQRVDETGRERQGQDAGDARRRGEIEDRANGTDTEASRARRAYREAIAKRDATKEGTHERGEADDDVRSAKLDITEARRNMAERAAQRQRAIELAKLTGPQSEQERARLAGEQKDIQEQLRPGSATYERNAEKRRDLEVRLAENARDQHQLERANQQRAFGRREQEIAANTGRGSAEQVQAIDARLKLKADQQADNDANEKDVNVTSRLNAEVAQLKRQKDEILFAEKESLATLEDQTNALSYHGQQLDANARKTLRHAQEQREIDQAEHDNDPEKAKGLRAKQALEDFNDDVDDSLLTPEERLARGRHNDTINRARASQDTRQRRSGEVDAANRGDFDARFHQRHAPIALPNIIDGIRAGMQNAGKGEEAFTDKNIVSGLKEVVTAVKESAPDFRNRA